MKKLLTFIVSSALAFSLAACGSQSAAEENTAAAAETAEAAAETERSAEAETSADTNASEETTAQEEASDGGVLVAYFSWSGNTEQMAQIIAEETGADQFEIAPATPYTDDYNELLDIAQQEQADNARPELAAQVENWDSYDTVFVGYPNWCGTIAPPLASWLYKNELSGKILLPFYSHCGGVTADFRKDIGKLCPKADVREPLQVIGNGGAQLKEVIEQWLQRNGIF